jgi:hypothetical protein
MQVTINVPKNVINNIKRSAEIYGGVTPTDAQIQEFLQWHVLGIYTDFHGEDLEHITAENFN